MGTFGNNFGNNWAYPFAVAQSSTGGVHKPLIFTPREVTVPKKLRLSDKGVLVSQLAMKSVGKLKITIKLTETGLLKSSLSLRTKALVTSKLQLSELNTITSKAAIAERNELLAKLSLVESNLLAIPVDKRKQFFEKMASFILLSEAVDEDE